MEYVLIIINLTILLSADLTVEIAWIESTQRERSVNSKKRRIGRKKRRENEFVNLSELVLDPCRLQSLEFGRFKKEEYFFFRIERRNMTSECLLAVHWHFLNAFSERPTLETMFYVFHIFLKRDDGFLVACSKS